MCIMRKIFSFILISFFFIWLGVASVQRVSAEPITARPAYDFVNSVGLATHFDWGPSPYAARFSEVKAALKELGVRHIRQPVGNTASAARLRSLYAELGVKLIAIMDARNGSGSSQQLNPGGIAALLNSAKTTVNPNMIVAIEGPNEWNRTEALYGRTTWPEELRNYQAQLFQRVKADPVLGAKPVVAPSLSDPMSPGQYAKLGNMEAWTDRANAHVYPNWLPFEQKFSQVLPYVRLAYPTQRSWVTETAWHTAYNSGAQFIDEATRAKYIGRAMAHYATNPQLERAYYYQLVDDTANPAYTINNKHMGLMTNNLQRNPAFYALRNTLAIMCDAPLQFSPESLDINLSGNLTDVRTALFQHNNHSFFLLIWREQPGFYKGKPVVNSPQPITISVGPTILWARYYRPTGPEIDLAGAFYRRTAFYVFSNFTYPIDDSLTIFELIPYARPAREMNSSCDFRPV